VSGDLVLRVLPRDDGTTLTVLLDPSGSRTVTLSDASSSIVVLASELAAVSRALAALVMGHDAAAEARRLAIAALPKCCLRGHPLDATNAYQFRSHLVCRACIRLRYADTEPLPDRREAALTCVHGHVLTPKNTVQLKDGRRECRVCLRLRNRRYDARKKKISAPAAAAACRSVESSRSDSRESPSPGPFSREKAG
jgi:hypothetical protein